MRERRSASDGVTESRIQSFEMAFRMQNAAPTVQDLTKETPETLRCYPGDSRPDDFVTIPRFAAMEARRLAEKRKVPADREAWEKSRRQCIPMWCFAAHDRQVPTAF